jgi:ABC-type glutathione transport system ATPase component
MSHEEYHETTARLELPANLDELPRTPDNDTATLTTNKSTPGPAESTSKKTELNEKGGTDTDTEDEYDERVTEAQRSSLVQHLARQYTNKSHASGVTGANPFAEHANDPDSPLNPNGEKFSARAWARNVVELISGEGHTFRTSGIAFQNLNVFGYGAGTDYQKDVANVWLGFASTVRGLFGGSKKRIDILRDFDGVVRRGEMLVVLGPPGSGCSTMLKTVSGEMNGIYVEDSSYFNYQGKC